MERFKKENLEIVWNESKCIHAGICVKMLPKVYRPEETPWIHADCASVLGDNEKLQVELKELNGSRKVILWVKS